MEHGTRSRETGEKWRKSRGDFFGKSAADQAAGFVNPPRSLTPCSPPPALQKAGEELVLSLFSSLLRHFAPSSPSNSRIFHSSTCTMPLDLVRDSVFGQLVNYATNGRLLPYADQKPGYVVPSYLVDAPASTSSSPSRRGSTPLPPSRTLSQAPTMASTVVSPPETLVNENGICKELEKESSNIDVEKNQPPANEVETYPWLVRFEENDQDRPL